MTALTSLKQLHYLVAFSEQLNFPRAAESCFVTQSTRSAGLKELEAVLGAHLVERDRQTMSMTPIGLAVAKRARAILAATQDLVEIAASAGEPMTGLLRLGVIPTIAPFLLPRSLPLLRERYPKLRLTLREDLTAICCCDLKRFDSISPGSRCPSRWRTCWWSRCLTTICGSWGGRAIRK